MESITVVTASVNRPSLTRAIDSVRAQTLKPVAHRIFFQNVRGQAPHGPSIETPPVPLFAVFSTDKHNIVTAYNAACEMADTPLIAMLDDDCWWEPNHLENLARLMDETASDFVWASSVLHDEATGAVVQMRDDDAPVYEHIDTNEILFRRSCIEKWGNHLESDADPRFPGLLRGIDGRRIERWVKGGAVYAHSRQHTVHYTWREKAEF
jgi:glycosyltransferase involved in cell wall biosynthesis